MSPMVPAENWMSVQCPRCSAPEGEQCRDLRIGQSGFNNTPHPDRRLLACPQENRRCAVYRTFDTQSQLLYVGCSYDPAERMDEHRRDSRWFPAMEHYSVEWFEDRDKALDAELTAIQTEKPAHNILGWLHEATATPEQRS